MQSEEFTMFKVQQRLHIQGQVLQQNFNELLDPEVEGTTMLQNVEDYSPNDSVSTSQSRIFNNTVVRFSNFALTVSSLKKNVPHMTNKATTDRNASI